MNLTGSITALALTTPLLTPAGLCDAANWVVSPIAKPLAVQSRAQVNAGGVFEKANNSIPWSVGFAVEMKGLQALQAGWDGIGSQPTDPRALAAVDALVTAALAGRHGALTSPFLAPAGDGSVQVEWHEKHGELELLVEPDGALAIWGRDHRNGFEFEGSDKAALDLFYRWAPRMAAQPRDVDHVVGPPQSVSFAIAA